MYIVTPNSYTPKPQRGDMYIGSVLGNRPGITMFAELATAECLHTLGFPDEIGIIS